MKNKFLAAVPCALAVMLAARAQAARPDLNGVWQLTTPVTALATIDGKAPPLLPEAAKIYAARQQQLKNGDRGYDATQKCKPMGEPRTAYDPEGTPMEISLDAKEMVIRYTWNRMLRFVYLNGKAPDPLGPTYYGTSTGAWHGDTLVVSVAQIHDTTMLDQAGMPHSEAMTLTESFALADQGRVLNETIRFEDPKIFSRPWETRISFRRLPSDTRLVEDVCETRLHVRGM